VVTSEREQQPVDGPVDGPVSVVLRGLVLPGHLAVPADARGVVVFAHGAASDHRSARNGFVARRLVHEGFGALLFDLRAPDERVDDGLDDGATSDFELLAVRVLAATRWLRERTSAPSLPVGYFGAGAGAGVALLAAAEDPSIAAVVARDGRPDLAGPWLQAVRAPTLLIVGGDDPTALTSSQAASRRLRSEHEVVVVPGASHDFDEPGALEVVADQSADWFVRHLGSSAPRTDTRGSDPR